jgi:O-antigen ligase
MVPKSNSAIEQRFRSAFFKIIAVSPVIYGYIAIVSVVIATIGGILDVINGRGKGKVYKNDLLLIVPGLFYFSLVAISLIRSDFEIEDISYLDRPAIFLSMYFLLVHFRKYSNEKYVDIFVKYIPVGAVLLIPYLCYEAWYLQARMEAGARNAIPFAMISLILAQMSLLNLLNTDKRFQLFGVFGFIIYSLAVVFSQTRSVQMLYVFSIVMTVWFISKQKLFSRNMIIVVCCAVVLSISLAFSSDAVKNRFQLLTISISNVIKGREISDASINERLEMLNKGWCLASKSVFVGYGIANRRALLNENVGDAESSNKECYRKPHPYYNHFHNAYITAAIDFGILGSVSVLLLILSPFVFTVRSASNQYTTYRYVISTSLVATYGLESLIGQPVGGDLLDAFYVILCLLLVLSVSSPNKAATKY